MHNHDNCSCTINGAANQDPSRTAGLRRAYQAETKRRFIRLKRRIVETIVINDALGLLPVEQPSAFARIVLQGYVPPRAWAGKSVDEVAMGFSAWLALEENAIIFDQARIPLLAQFGNNIWYEEFLIAAFIKGMKRGRAELASSGTPTKALTEIELRQLLILPPYRDRLMYLLNRAYTDLNNITAVMGAKLQRILIEGMAEGISAQDIARRIAKGVDDIGVRRALTLARTETMAAHHAATIAEYRAAGVMGVRLLAEWLTAGDRRVCPVCQSLSHRDSGNGPGIYTIDQIEYMIPAHPNCRCVAIPVDITDSV